MSSPPPVGRREFFVLEAGEYLERLSLLAGIASPDTTDLVRYARALRGAAMMAGPPGFSDVGAALEATAKAIREGGVSWAPALAERFGGALETCKLLLRRVREWSDVDVQRCERLTVELESLGGTPRAAGPSLGRVAVTPGVRAYLAREASAVAAQLDHLAEAPPAQRPGLTTSVLQRLQPLRGLGGLPELSPLPELLEALDLALSALAKGSGWSTATGQALRASGLALTRMARDIAELDIPQHDSHEILHATRLLRDAFVGSHDVVAVESLFADGDAAPVVAMGTPPLPPPGGVEAGARVELVSLSERLHHAAEQVRAGTGRATRDLQLFSLALILRGLAGDGLPQGSLDRLLGGLDRAIMTGQALALGSQFAALLDQAADLVARAAEPANRPALAEELPSLMRRLAGLAGTAAPAAPAAAATGEEAVPIASLAPDQDGDIVPIESLFYDVAAPAMAPGLLPFEQSFSTYFRLLHRAAPPPAPEQAAVPIQSLLYRGRSALERADLVRRELTAALRVQPDLRSVETLLEELLDLVPLALDDGH